MNTHSSHCLIIKNCLTNRQADKVGKNNETESSDEKGQSQGSGQSAAGGTRSIRAQGKPCETWPNIDKRNGLS